MLEVASPNELNSKRRKLELSNNQRRSAYKDIVLFNYFIVYLYSRYDRTSRLWRE